MSELVDAIRSVITKEILSRPTSIRGEIIDKVDDNIYNVRFTNPAAKGDVVVNNVLVPYKRGIWQSGLRVGDRVTVALSQGDLTVPSIVEERWPYDDPLLAREESSVERTSEFESYITKTALPLHDVSTISKSSNPWPNIYPSQQIKALK